MTDTAALRAAAQAAEPILWKFSPAERAALSDLMPESDVAFVELASPDRILALCEENDDLRASLLDAYNAMDAATRESQTTGIKTVEEADRHIRWFDALLDGQVRAGEALGILRGRAALEGKPTE